MTYQYTVRDPLGRVTSGELEAASPEEAGQVLRRDGLEVIRLEKREQKFELFSRRVGVNEIICLAQQLSIMADTGVPLTTALESMMEQEANPTLRKLLGALKNDLEAGESFSVALEKHPQYFDRAFVAMVRASEQTGTLGPMLEQAGTYLRKDLENRGKLRGAMIYPGVMLAFAVVVTVGLLVYVFPQFAPLFKQKKIELPITTVVLMGLSHALREFWWMWLVGVGAAAGAFWWWRKTPDGARVLDTWKINAPVMGVLARKASLGRSIRTLGAMLQSDVPMLDALSLSAEVSNNHHYEQSWKRVADEVTQGGRIRKALAGDPLFPPTLLQMIGSGEETGRLGEVLAKVSDYYEREVDSALKAVTSMLEPIMVVTMGGVVGCIAYSLLIPIFQLSSTPT